MTSVLRKKEVGLKRVQWGVALLFALLLSVLGSLVLKDMPFHAKEYSELKVFLMRLAFTIPLVAGAGWVWLKKRQSSSKPFVDGFAVFALITFFFELLPYLPSYGGYVRYGVGIVLVVVLGKLGLQSLQRYLDGLKERESLPETSTPAPAIDYDKAFQKYSASTCPACERGINIQQVLFCPHCATSINHKCIGCGTSQSSFTRYCSQCAHPRAESATAANEHDEYKAGCSN